MSDSEIRRQLEKGDSFSFEGDGAVQESLSTCRSENR